MANLEALTIIVKLDNRALSPLKDVAERVCLMAERDPSLRGDADYIGLKLLECRDCIRASNNGDVDKHG